MNQEVTHESIGTPVVVYGRRLGRYSVDGWRAQYLEAGLERDVPREHWALFMWKEILRSGRYAGPYVLGSIVREGAQILVQTNLAKTESEAPATNPSKPPKHAGGRRPIYPWEDFVIELGRYNHEHGLPSNQADLVRVMFKWCKDNWKKEPVDSEVRLRVSKFYSAIRAAGN